MLATRPGRHSAPFRHFFPSLVNFRRRPLASFLRPRSFLNKVLPSLYYLSFPSVPFPALKFHNSSCSHPSHIPLISLFHSFFFYMLLILFSNHHSYSADPSPLFLISLLPFLLVIFRSFFPSSRAPSFPPPLPPLRPLPTRAPQLTSHRGR